MAVNKSAAIREALEKKPDATVKDIVAMLSARGIRVKPQLVYFIKAQAKKKVRKAKREVAVATASSNGISIELIAKIRELATEAGGYGQLKQLVDVLA